MVMRDLVAVDLPPGPAFLDALRAAWDAGDAVLPLQREAPAQLRIQTAEKLGATVVVDGGGRRTMDGGWPVEEGDALVMATSGTTGLPKGVVLTHDSVEYSAFATATALGAEADTHWLACLPLSHVGGLSVVTRAWTTTAGLTVHDRFDAAAVSRAVSAGATHVSLVPTALARIDPAPWRRILLGGSAIPDDRPANCVATYGMTETYGGVVYDGLALNGVEVRIGLADTQQQGSTSGGGPIELRSPTLLRCYRDGTDPVDDQGWLRTGDLGLLAADGHLEVLGRADDLIITGGENVWPEPVEAILETHPGVLEAAVVGRPDREWGQRVCALVVPVDPGSPPDLAELRQWVRDSLATPAAPKELRLVAALPRTSLGKLRRSTLATVGIADTRRET